MFNMRKTSPDGKKEPLFTAAATTGKRRAEALLAALLRRAEKEGPFTEIVDLTPELAELLLASNADNRNVSPGLVEGISRDIIEGRWVFNGETLIVSIDGQLNDGQHRCLAVIKAARPVRTNISFGLDRNTRLTVDGQQKTRMPGDYLAMDGFANAHNIAAAAGYIWQIERFGSIPEKAASKHFRPTKQQVSEVAHRYHEDLQEALSAAPSKGSQKVASLSLLAVTYLLISRATEDKAAAKEFIRRIVDGVELAATSPIYVVRERLMKDKRERKFTPRSAVMLMLRGWNAHRRNQPYSKAQLGDNWPKIAR